CARTGCVVCRGLQGADVSAEFRCGPMRDEVSVCARTWCRERPGVEVGTFEGPQHSERDGDLCLIETFEEPTVCLGRRPRGGVQVDPPRVSVLLEPSQLIDKRGRTCGKHGLRGPRCSG